MKDKLTQYIDLLFAGTPAATDVKQEILQNTLDRYDDLIAQGKSPEAAYQLAITGIGDISEILCSEDDTVPTVSPVYNAQEENVKPIWKKVLHAIGICLYIMCPIPLFVLQNELGLCGLLTFVAVATALMVISGSKEKVSDSDQTETQTPKSELRKAVHSIIWAMGLCAYFAVSFSLGAWHVTWIIFPLIGAVQGLVNACMDLKEGK